MMSSLNFVILCSSRERYAEQNLQIKHPARAPVWPVDGEVPNVCLPAQERMTVAELRKAMRNTSHNGFPVTRHAPSGEVCRVETLEATS